MFENLATFFSVKIILSELLSYFDFGLPSELLLKRYKKYLVKKDLS